MSSLLAYKFVAIAVMLNEINFCAGRLHLAVRQPIKQSDICSALVLDPAVIGFSGRLEVSPYTFVFAQSGRLRYLVKSNEHAGQSLLQYEKGLSRTPSSIDNEGARRIARTALQCMDVDVGAMESTHPCMVKQRFVSYHEENKEHVVAIPIFDVKWGNWVTPNVAVVISGMTEEILSLRQEDDSYSTRPEDLIKNTNKLLAIPDVEFLKYTAAQRLEVVKQYAAVDYPVSQRREVANSGDTSENKSNARCVLSSDIFRQNRLSTELNVCQTFREAVNALVKANRALKYTKEDYCGHRALAIDACGKAIQYLELFNQPISLSRIKAIDPMAHRLVAQNPTFQSEIASNLALPVLQSCRDAVLAVRRAKRQLQHLGETNDDNNKAATDACNKAIEELLSVVRVDLSPHKFPRN